MYILGYPLGLIMRLLYNILHSYGWSLIIFTLLVKLVMVPLSIKQQKSSAKMAAIQPQMQEIQKMYAKNQQKMNEELQKLYQRENYNPAGGCLPMLITFLVLFGLIDVIYKPMTHILGMSSDLIAQAQGIMEGLGVAFSHYSPQTSIITSVQANPEAYSALGQDFINAVRCDSIPGLLDCNEKQSYSNGRPWSRYHEDHDADFSIDVPVHCVPGSSWCWYLLDHFQPLDAASVCCPQQVL